MSLVGLLVKCTKTNILNCRGSHFSQKLKNNKNKILLFSSLLAIGGVYSTNYKEINEALEELQLGHRDGPIMKYFVHPAISDKSRAQNTSTLGKTPLKILDPTTEARNLLEFVERSVEEAENAVLTAHGNTLRTNQSLLGVLSPKGEESGKSLQECKQTTLKSIQIAEDKLNSAVICFENLSEKSAKFPENDQRIKKLRQKLENLEKSLKDDQKLDHVAEMTRETELYFGKTAEDLEDIKKGFVNQKIDFLRNKCSQKRRISQKLSDLENSILKARDNIINQITDEKYAAFSEKIEILNKIAVQEIEKNTAERLERLRSAAHVELSRTLEENSEILRQEGQTYLEDQSSKRSAAYAEELKERENLFVCCESLRNEKILLKESIPVYMKIAEICEIAEDKLEFGVKTDFDESLEELKTLCKGNDYLESIIPSTHVISLQELQASFWKVSRMSWRVVPLGERKEYGLLDYLVSLVHSFLVVDSVSDVSHVVDGDMFCYIGCAKEYMRKGDIMSAVRLMGNLKGEAGVVSSTWVTQALRFLEMRQAINMINAYARYNVRIASNC